MDLNQDEAGIESTDQNQEQEPKEEKPIEPEPVDEVEPEESTPAPAVERRIKRKKKFIPAHPRQVQSTRVPSEPMSAKQTVILDEVNRIVEHSPWEIWKTELCMDGPVWVLLIRMSLKEPKRYSDCQLDVRAAPEMIEEAWRIAVGRFIDMVSRRLEEDNNETNESFHQERGAITVDMRFQCS